MNRLTATLLITLLLLLSAPASARATDGWMRHRGHPHGDYCEGIHRGRYGARRPVNSAREATRVLERYYSDADVIIGPIKERPLFYEARISDRKGNLIDRVIVDKKSCRIRSIE
ncbi:MAG: hypothetical protein AB1442_00955 [Nitrospirota bacterium]